MTLLGTIVDTSALAKVIVASLVAGIGVTIAFSFAILGAIRFADMRRAEHPLGAAIYGLLAVIGAAISIAGVVFGIVIMTSK